MLFYKYYLIYVLFRKLSFDDNFFMIPEVKKPFYAATSIEPPSLTTASLPTTSPP